MSSTDVIVVGGGIMGCSVALRLAREGVSVTVLERSVPGAEASTAAAGILGPMMEADHAPERELSLRLGLRARALHAEWARELRERHELDVGHRETGLMRLAFSESEAEALRAHAAWLRASGVPEAAEIELLDGGEARRREPNLSPEVVMALEFSGEGQIAPKRLLPALSMAAEREGARFRTDTVVRAILTDDAGDGRAIGVQLDGEALHAGCVVVAAGSWTTLVPGVALPPSTIAPVKGQVLFTRARPRLFERVIFGGGGYVLTRADGDVLIGATTERVGFSRGVTLGGLRSLVDIATRVAPSLDGAPVLDHWAGFRPGTPDGLPLVGATPIPGLVLASGHYRNGILLGPLTGELVRDVVLGRELDADARRLSPTRFR